MPRAWGRLGYGREVLKTLFPLQLKWIISYNLLDPKYISCIKPPRAQVSVDLANKSADEVYLAIAGLESN